MSRQGRYIGQLKRKQRKRRIALLIIFITVLLSTGVIASIAYMSTDVYGDEEQFREYVDTYLEQSGPFKVDKVMKTDYQYGTPISYAIDYDVCKDQYIEAFRKEKIDAIKNAFSQTKSAEEAERAKEQKDNKRYRPLEQALIIRTAVYEARSGVTSLVIYESENSEKDKAMAETVSNIYTYQFSEKTGAPLIPQQVFAETYKGVMSEYFKEYFEKNYDKEQLTENWQEYVADAEGNFNKYIITETGATFFFDEGTVLKPSNGIVCAGISYVEMGGVIRPQVLERYIDPAKPMVALTYDDGPGGDSETRIIQCLKRNGAVATFFYLGSRVGLRPDNVKAAYDLGCEIGNHTWSHPVLTDLTDAQAKSQLDSANEAIKNACGAYPTLFRPSYGETNQKINDMSGMPVIMWSVDTLDWKHRNGKKVFDYVTGLSNLDGKVILLHSIHDSTADATEMLVPWLKEHGYQMVTVTELFRYRKGTELQKGSVYR